MSGRIASCVSLGLVLGINGYDEVTFVRSLPNSAASALPKDQLVENDVLIALDGHVVYKMPLAAVMKLLTDGTRDRICTLDFHRRDPDRDTNIERALAQGALKRKIVTLVCGDIGLKHASDKSNVRLAFPTYYRHQQDQRQLQNCSSGSSRDLTYSIHQDQAEIARLLDDLSSLKAAHALSTERERLAKIRERETHENDSKRSETQIQDLKTNLTELQKEFATLQSEHIQTMFTMKKESQALKTECMTAKERNSTLDMQLTNTKAALVQAERKNADLAKEYAVLQTENMSAPATIAGLQKELNEAKDTLEQSHIIIGVRDDEYSQAIMTMGKESQALKVQYITVMEMNAALDLQLAKTKEAFLQAERKNADSDIAFAVIQAENKSFSATISTLQKELNETKDTLEQHQIIVGWNHTQMEDLSKAMDDYKSKLAELKNENAKLRSNADALRKELQTCKDQVMEEGSLFRKELADAQRGLDDVGAKMIKSLNSELERLRKELAEAREQLATSNNVESMMAQFNEALAQALNREAVANTNASVAASACAEATTVNALLEAEVTRLKQEAEDVKTKFTEEKNDALKKLADTMNLLLQAQEMQCKDVEVKAQEERAKVSQVTQRLHAETESKNALVQSLNAQMQEHTDLLARLHAEKEALTTAKAQVKELQERLHHKEARENELKASEIKLRQGLMEKETSKAALEDSLGAQMQAHMSVQVILERANKELKERLQQKDARENELKAIEIRLSQRLLDEETSKAALENTLRAQMQAHKNIQEMLEKAKKELQERLQQKEARENELKACETRLSQRLYEEEASKAALEDSLKTMQPQWMLEKANKCLKELEDRLISEKEQSDKDKGVLVKRLADHMEQADQYKRAMEDRLAAEAKQQAAAMQAIAKGKEEHKRAEDEHKMQLKAADMEKERLALEIQEFKASEIKLRKQLLEKETSQATLEDSLKTQMQAHTSLQEMLENANKLLEKANKELQERLQQKEARENDFKTSEINISQRLQEEGTSKTALEESLRTQKQAHMNIQGMLEKANKELQERLQQKEARENELKVDKERLEEEVTRLRGKVKVEEKERAKVEEERVRLRGEVESLKKNLANLWKEHGPMTETILSLNKEVKNLQQSLATSSELNENLRKQITDMQQICEASVAKGAETAKRSAEKEIEIEKAKCTKTIAEAERKFERDVQSYKDALAATEIISQKNQKMREELESQLECDKNKHEELKRKINLLNNELAAAQRNLSEEQAHSLVLRENLAALWSGKAPDISKMQGEKRDTEAQLAADKDAIAAFEKEIATLKNEKSTLKNENSALNKVVASESAVSIDQHRKVRDALEKQLEQEKSKLNDLITESNKEKELIGREVTVLKNELAAAKHTIGTLQSEIVNIKPGSSAEDTGKVDGQIDTQSESLWGLNAFQLLDRAMKKVGSSTASSDPSPSHQGEKKDTEASVSLFSTRGWGGPAQEEKKETEAQLAAARDVIIAALEKEIETLKHANAVDPKCLDVVKKIQEWVAKDLFPPHLPVIRSTSSTPKTTLGLHLESKGDESKGKVERVLIGGPAYTANIVEGDTLLAIDGEQVEGNVKSAAELIKGNDVIGSVCTVMVKKSVTKKIETIKLHKMDINLLNHLRQMHQLLRDMKHRLDKGDVDGLTNQLEQVRDVWNKTILEQHAHDEACRKRIDSMKTNCKTWLDELQTMLEPSPAAAFRNSGWTPRECPED